MSLLIHLAADDSMMSTVLTFGGIIGIFYFILIRPQQKERKLQESMRASLAKGQDVLVQGGIIARVHAVKDKEVVLELEGARMRVLKEAILRRLDDDGKTTGKAPTTKSGKASSAKTAEVVSEESASKN